MRHTGAGYRWLYLAAATGLLMAALAAFANASGERDNQKPLWTNHLRVMPLQHYRLPGEASSGAGTSVAFVSFVRPRYVRRPYGVVYFFGGGFGRSSVYFGLSYGYGEYWSSGYDWRWARSRYYRVPYYVPYYRRHWRPRHHRN